MRLDEVYAVSSEKLPTNFAYILLGIMELVMEIAD